MIERGDLYVGQRAWWTRVCGGNFGQAEYIPVTVQRIGKRVTVEARLRRGGTKLVAVSRERLSAAQQAARTDRAQNS
jgi:hypothetical protein